MGAITYPFIPKSNRYLLPGQYWALSLSNGQFGAGRVIQVSTENRTLFLAGLMDWTGPNPPTGDDLAGRKTITQGEASFRTILDTGGAILGHRPLELDRLEPDLFLSQGGRKGAWVQKGLDWLYPASDEEWLELDAITTWGRLVIQVVAERVLVRGLPLINDPQKDLLRARLRQGES